MEIKLIDTDYSPRTLNSSVLEFVLGQQRGW